MVLREQDDMSTSIVSEADGYAKRSLATAMYRIALLGSFGMCTNAPELSARPTSSTIGALTASFIVKVFGGSGLKSWLSCASRR